MTHSFNKHTEEREQTGIYEDDQYDDVAPLQAGSDVTLKLIDWTLRPHMHADYVGSAHVTLHDMEQAAANVHVPLYAIDDQMAIKVIVGHADVFSEVQWELFSSLAPVK